MQLVNGSLLPSAGHLWYFLTLSLMLTYFHHTVAAYHRWSALTVINVIFLSETQVILKLKSQNTVLKCSGGDIRQLFTNTRLFCV